MSSSDVEVIDLKVIGETPAAYKVRQEIKNRAVVEDWIPKSQISYKRTQGEFMTVKIPEWLAEKKGFKYY